jgi:hypothetical protein
MPPSPCDLSWVRACSRSQGHSALLGFPCAWARTREIEVPTPSSESLTWGLRDPRGSVAVGDSEGAPTEVALTALVRSRRLGTTIRPPVGGSAGSNATPALDRGRRRGPQR